MSHNVSFADKMQRKVTFRVNQKTFADLDEIARLDGFTVSLLVRHLVCRYVEQHKRITPPRPTIKAVK